MKTRLLANTNKSRILHRTFQRNCFFLIAATFLLMSSNLVFAQTAPQGGVSGHVSNAATKEFLQDAAVLIVESGTTVVTDRAGNFTVEHLAPGDYTLLISYSGLDPERQTVAVANGRTANVEVALSSAIYTLAPITVAGEREGNAKAIMVQRYANNVKNIVDTDAFGAVADGNLGDFLKVMPGVVAEGKNGETFTLRIRGIDPNLNSVTVDGFKTANAQQDGTATRTFEIGLSPIDGLASVELTKSPLPSQPADSIGAAVNLISKSALDRTYTGPRGSIGGGASIRSYRNTTVYNVRGTFQDLYSVGGGQRNLAVSVTASSSDNFIPIKRTELSWDPTAVEPSSLQTFKVLEPRLTRRRAGGTLNLDYKLSAHTTFKLRTTVDLYSEKAYENNYEFAAVKSGNFTSFNPDGSIRTKTTTSDFGQTVTVPIGTDGSEGGILPGYTSNLTRSIDSTFAGRRRPYWKIRQSVNVGFIGEHKFTDLSVDYGLQRGSSQARRVEKEDGRDGGQLSWQVKYVGVDLSATDEPGLKKIVQTSGPDVLDPANWSLKADGVRHQNFFSWQKSINAYANATKVFPEVLGHSLKFQSGLLFTESAFTQNRDESTYSFVGPDGKANTIDDHGIQNFVDVTRVPFPMYEGRYYAPKFLSTSLINASIEQHPELWKTDPNKTQQTWFKNNNAETENNMAAYTQGATRLGRLGILTGIRFEQTAIITRTHPSIAGVAQPSRVKKTAYYCDYFPGLHLRYNLTQSLQLRASFSKSIGRPDIGSLISTEDINDVSQKITAATPFLLPQHSNNYDVNIEYYFEPVGLLSAGYFRKDINGFVQTISQVLGANNPYGTQYEGYSLSTQANFGDAQVEGFELAYQQQLTFLPGLLKGLGVNANYTHIETQGNRGGSDPGAGLTNFIPRAANAGVSWRYLRFEGRIKYNWVDTYMTGYNISAPNRDYTLQRGRYDLNTTYNLYKNLSLYLDVFDMFNSHEKLFKGEGQVNRLTFDEDDGVRYSVGATLRL